MTRKYERNLEKTESVFCDTGSVTTVSVSFPQHGTRCSSWSYPVQKRRRFSKHDLKGGTHADMLQYLLCLIRTQHLMAMYGILKMEDAAKELGIGVTYLKKICRKMGIYRWPHRQVS